MKKLILLITAVTVSFSCEEKATIEFDDPKSQAVLGIFEAVSYTHLTLPTKA